jgi:hypothetical protein
MTGRLTGVKRCSTTTGIVLNLSFNARAHLLKENWKELNRQVTERKKSSAHRTLRFIILYARAAATNDEASWNPLL